VEGMTAIMRPGNHAQYSMNGNTCSSQSFR
jgi:hypothetical protein